MSEFNSKQALATEYNRYISNYGVVSDKLVPMIDNVMQQLTQNMMHTQTMSEQVMQSHQALHESINRPRQKSVVRGPDGLIQQVIES